MVDYTALPYANWLEEANKALIDINPDSIYFGLVKNGEVISSYYNFSNIEQALVINELLTNSVLDKLEEHLDDLIQQYLNENNDDADTDNEENIEDDEIEGDIR